MRTPTSSERGFSLIESILAIGLLVTALITLAHLLAVAVQTGSLATHVTFTTILAAQKMEQLLTERVLDETSSGVDGLDSSGATVCDVAVPCAAMVYIRRWSVEPVGNLYDGVLIDVRVDHRRRGRREARLLSIRARVRE